MIASMIGAAQAVGMDIPRPLISLRRDISAMINLHFLVALD